MKASDDLKAKPFSTEELKQFDKRYGSEHIIARFKATIVADRKRIEELEKENLTLLKRQIKLLNKIDIQAYEIERLREKIRKLESIPVKVRKISDLECEPIDDEFIGD